MIKKQDLIDNIEKYYLNGLVENTKWDISEGSLDISFVSPNQDLVGVIHGSLELNEKTIGVFNTSALLKMLNILEEEIDINTEKQNNLRLIIKDSNYLLNYSLADPNIISKVPSITEPGYDVEFDIDSDFISKFIKGKNALGSIVRDIVNFSYGDKFLKIVLGESSSHSNKISYSHPIESNNFTKENISFNSSHIKEIFSSNKERLKEGKGYLSKEGLLKLEFKSDIGISIYYLPKLEE